MATTKGEIVMSSETLEVISTNKGREHERKSQHNRNKVHHEHVRKLENTIDMLLKQKAYLQKQLRKKKLNEEKNDK